MNTNLIGHHLSPSRLINQVRAFELPIEKRPKTPTRLETQDTTAQEKVAGYLEPRHRFMGIFIVYGQICKSFFKSFFGVTSSGNYTA
ncbi:MAG: hypothetical protein ONB31_02740 [candidate division KSB1 bacterium]|nr:hypothetical protein [candidate division KSB1 bacterium]MDZ7333973.1 hypothetical protein [candidate division KSB1 bacterium]MDZ7357987.1 hypothetical protein [candidate division KSB1 bacterium]MDZ7399958.1 hypothetical protein [candidate division KSB1 bacterium]